MGRISVNPMKIFSLPPKEELASKLLDYPTLNSILCLLLYERLFRWAFVGGLLFVPLFLGFVLKIWTVSPAGFVPVVKMSGLDFVQAWSLRRTAMKEAAAGKHEDAFHTWRVAVANNPASPELLRGFLEHMLRMEPAAQHTQIAVGFTRWLMRLTETNLVDLELSAKVYQKYDLDDWTIQALGSVEERLTPFLQGKLLQALFNRDQISRFDELWQRVDPARIVEKEVFLHRAAYLAGWGHLDEAAEGKRVLEEAMQTPETRILAHRLNLKVSERLVRPAEYEASLGVLQEWRQDKLRDHLHYWELMAAVGRRGEAIRLLQSYVFPPGAAEEAVLLAKAHFDLGLVEESREILKRYSLEFTDSEAVWLSYSNLLIELGRWEDLFSVALQIRHELNPLRDHLEGYSYFLQGRAEDGRGRREQARQAFQRIYQVKLRNHFWELAAAEQVERLGYPETAQAILLDIQSEVEDQPEYWVMLAKTAYEQRDAELLVSALASAYKLRPNDFVIVNNYAAALLSTRQRPEEALALTERVLLQNPNLISSRVNHALALLQTGRVEQARELIGTLHEGLLEGSNLTGYHMASFEMRLQEGNVEQALRHLEKVDGQYLLPPEKYWIEKTRHEISLEEQGVAAEAG
jgi:tetratricopeptide (TPR) repeat protein